jgi:hypothetical protein
MDCGSEGAFAVIAMVALAVKAEYGETRDAGF